MKVLLTGGSGLVGRNFLEHPACKRLEIVTPSSKELNLTVYENVLKYISYTKPDIIIHAAGVVGGIQANITNPVKFLVANIDMGRNLLLAARENGIKRCINLGSSCMYPRNATNPLAETQVLAGDLEPTNEGYAIAKIAVSRLGSYITQENSAFQYKTLIPCNLYGRWDKFEAHHSHLIPSIIEKLHRAKVQHLNEVEIWGDGLARREFMYAGDFADCLHAAIMGFDQLPGLMNVGLGFDYSVNEYYNICAQIIGFQGRFIHDLTKPVGMAQKMVDISRQTSFGWKPKVSLAEGIQRTYEFYCEQRKRL